jgi:hypothetical protein
VRPVRQMFVERNMLLESSNLYKSFSGALFTAE